jgi:DNA-binding response OmpR family regulator
MTDAKPQVVYFSDKQALLDQVTTALSREFEVTGVTGVISLDELLLTVRRIKPDYVLVDPRLPDIDHQQLHHRIKSDEELNRIQILVIRDDPSDL